MRVLIINTAERIGGAAIAANRLMVALNNNGIKAKMLVSNRQTEQITVVSIKNSWKTLWNFVWERFVIWGANNFRRHNLFAVDIANTGTDITRLPEFVQADVIHLHWINQGMLSLKNIKQIIDSGKPIVWTMHDMWPFTGICHHAGTCTKYTTGCNNCPLLYRGNSKDISYHTFHRKKKLFGSIISKITFVACSHWLESLAQKSILTHGHLVTSIPNPINVNLFKPLNKKLARKQLNLPTDKKLILFCSAKTSDKMKGIDYLVEACRLLKEKEPEFSSQLAVVVLGRHSEQYHELFPFDVHCLDYVSNEKQLTEIYNAIDLYVTPSLQDNLPNTIVEAMSCGIPCVGFNVGGIPQMIDHLHNGYVAQYKSADDLAHGIWWSFNEGDYRTLSAVARHKALNTYSENIIAAEYLKIYNQATKKNE